MKRIKVKKWDNIPKGFTGIATWTTSGLKIWLKDGLLHREDGGPAVTYSTGEKTWYQKGKKHRTDGPACEWSDGIRQYWINGIETYKEAMEVYAMLFPKEE
jgi:hypothetical protein